jgi:hypothetical protein
VPFVAVFALCASSASATVLTEKISVVARHFVPAYPPPGDGIVEAQIGGLPPSDPLTGSFIVTFDPSQDGFGTITSSSFDSAPDPGFFQYIAPAGGPASLSLNLSLELPAPNLLTIKLIVGFGAVGLPMRGRNRSACVPMRVRRA